MRGDWYRDPWGWPELDWVVAARPQLALDRAGSAGVRRSVKLDVPKENFATRPAMVVAAALNGKVVDVRQYE
jgi:hypothetical protein